ncbi:MAG: spore coat protein CotJB [Lachnospiraceae bacterium]|nr:spore coat protein CotJB [Lachnospiraceae bacterium]
MNKDELLKELMQLDFMAVDLALYLNTHPDDTDGIEQYNKIIRAADVVREKYENMYGPLCSFRSMSGKDRFDWTDEPWPWQKEFN